jgi:hypothetical protein
LNLPIAFALNLLALVACVQSAPTAELPAALRAHLADETFGSVTSIRGLPLGIRDELQTMFGGSLDIADPGANVDAAATVPSRRLVAAGCARDHHCLIYYEVTGSPRSWRVALFRWTPESTTFEWGGVVRDELKTIEDVRGEVLSGRVRTATNW